MTRLAITVCSRPLPVHRGEPSPLVARLVDAGHCVRTVAEGPVDLRAADVVWILGNANWFPRLCRQLISAPKVGRPLVVIGHGEPLPLPRAAGMPWPRLHWRELAKIVLRDARATDAYSNYFRLRRLARHGLPDVLVVATVAWREFLAERGIAAHWVPFGYDPSYGHDLGLARDVGVLFLGALDVPRRRRIMRRLRRAGIGLQAAGSWSDPACWGEPRTLLLNRTKILLNLPRSPGEQCGQRLLLGMANKALVVSEPIYAPAPFVPGRHYVSAGLEEMPAAIRHYLSHDDERERIANEAYRLVTQELTAARSVSQLLALVEAGLSATVAPATCGSAAVPP